MVYIYFKEYFREKVKYKTFFEISLYYKIENYKMSQFMLALCIFEHFCPFIA